MPERKPVDLSPGRQAWTSHKSNTPPKPEPAKAVSLTAHKVPNPAPTKKALPKVQSDTGHKKREAYAAGEEPFSYQQVSRVPPIQTASHPASTTALSRKQVLLNRQQARANPVIVQGGQPKTLPDYPLPKPVLVPPIHTGPYVPKK